MCFFGLPFDLPFSCATASVVPRANAAFPLSQVGDGLEIYVVLAKNSDSLQGLQTIRDIQELTSNNDGERTFVIRKELKKD